jgi:hypothetical protein
MTGSWVTLTVFDALPTAQIARGRLLAEGISCTLVDRSLLSIGIVAGGLELQVSPPDLEWARAVLAQDFSGELELES